MAKAMSKNTRNVIQLSFKNDGDDLELFLFLKSKLNASHYIKEELWSLYKLGAPAFHQHAQESARFESNNITEEAAVIEEKAITTKTEEVASIMDEEVERDEIDW